MSERLTDAELDTLDNGDWPLLVNIGEREISDLFRQLAGEVRELRIALATTVTDQCSEDDDCRRQARRVLPAKEVDGDGYCVPLSDIVEKMADMIDLQRDREPAVRELMATIEKQLELERVRWGKDLHNSTNSKIHRVLTAALADPRLAAVWNQRE